MNSFRQYWQFFWYVARNWNLPMAFFMVYDNLRGARKYGGSTFGAVDLTHLTIATGDLAQSSRYEPVTFFMLEHLFTAFRKLSGETNITDLGCGKGRVLIVASWFGFTDIKGIDFAAELCREALANVSRIARPDLSFTIVNQNIVDYKLQEHDTVFFMFNPFTENVLKQFLTNLNASCATHPRTVYVIYAGPHFQQLLLDHGFAAVYQKKKLYLESVILVRDV